MIGKKKKILISILIIFFLFLGGNWLFQLYTGDFRPSKIKMELPYREDLNIHTLDEHEKERLLQVLNQSYSFLGKGNQVYAFESLDGHFVLKFFKFGHLKPGSWLSPLKSVPFIDKYIQKNEKVKLWKIQRIFSAYHIAWSKDKENSGLIFIHLNPDTSLNQFARVSDKLGITYTIDLDETVFVLQRKAIPLRTVLTDLLSKNEIGQAKKHLRDVIDMYVNEYQNGIFDHDHNIMYNIGISDGRPMRIDIGKIVYGYQYADPKFYQEDLNKIIHKRIGKWLKSYFPQHHKMIVDDLEAKIQELKDNEKKPS